ncbi:MAG: hypothetical protein WKF37_07200 [Bryobacteraceae bacterium]
MIISSLALLFLLWAVRGIDPVPDRWLVPACMALIAIPNVVLAARVWVARRRQDKQTLAIAVVDDHRDHLLVYLFAMLIPLLMRTSAARETRRQLSRSGFRYLFVLAPQPALHERVIRAFWLSGLYGARLG